MKNLWIISLFVFIGLLVGGCHEPTVGYLLTKDASYKPNTADIRRTLNPNNKNDKIRIDNKSPWVSNTMQGYAGTQPIIFSIEDVSSTEGEEAALLFKEELNVQGGGALLYPFEPKHKVPAGRYTISVRLSNEDWSQVVEDAFTFVVKE